MKSINEVTAKELLELIKKTNDLVIIDVREAEEVAEGIIKDAIHIPLKDIPESTDDLKKGKHHVIVCRSGKRSLDAAAYLSKKGYNVSNMSGGMLDWKGDVIV